MFWTKCGLALWRPPQPNQRKGDKSVAKLGRSPSEPALHTPNFILIKWILVSLHPAAANADDLNCVRPLRKNKLHSCQCKDLSMGIGCFPTVASKKFI